MKEPVCPICNESIEHLTMYQKTPKIYKYYGDGESEFEDEMGPEEERVFECPMCGNFVTDDVEEADRILSYEE